MRLGFFSLSKSICRMPLETWNDSACAVDSACRSADDPRPMGRAAWIWSAACSRLDWADKSMSSGQERWAGRSRRRRARRGRRRTSNAAQRPLLHVQCHLIPVRSFAYPTVCLCRVHIYAVLHPSIRYGVVANIIASHAIARGSIPRVGILFPFEMSARFETTTGTGTLGHSLIRNIMIQPPPRLLSLVQHTYGLSARR